MNTHISSLAEVDADREAFWYREAERVFRETAAADRFGSRREREEFRYRYLEYYRTAAPDLFLVAFPIRDALAGPGEKIYGYICGVADTRNHPDLYRVAGHIPVFDDLYDRFPAHLHINLTAASRGLGIGSRLIAELEARLTGDAGNGSARRKDPVRGLHLVTSEGARNTRFYRNNGFTFEIARGMPGQGDNPVDEPDSDQGPRMLFMGKEL